MKAVPEGLDGSELRTALADEWGFHIDAASYLPQGFGSYHWAVESSEAGEGFVTVDDLDAKRWLGADRESTFVGLRNAFDAAQALRDLGGLEFVVSPVPTRGGATLARMGERYSVALFPMLDATAEPLGDLTSMDDRSDVVSLLVRLHAATAVVRSVATRRELQFAGRGELERTLRELDDPWTGGPFSERARAAVARDPERIARLLVQLDRLTAEVAASPGDLVITHGEPHGHNVMRAFGELVLVDWDTVALAAPERDLWMVDDGSGDALEEYADASGRKVRQSAIDLYRLAWDLNDIAEYTSQLRGEHRENEDTEAFAAFLEEYVRLLDRWDWLV